MSFLRMIAENVPSSIAQYGIEYWNLENVDFLLIDFSFSGVSKNLYNKINQKISR